MTTSHQEDVSMFNFRKFMSAIGLHQTIDNMEFYWQLCIWFRKIFVKQCTGIILPYLILEHCWIQAQILVVSSALPKLRCWFGGGRVIGPHRRCCRIEFENGGFRKKGEGRGRVINTRSPRQFLSLIRINAHVGWLLRLAGWSGLAVVRYIVLPSPRCSQDGMACLQLHSAGWAECRDVR